ncbi:MAG: hypothetical protein ABI904_23635, partial [Chloroflexota bacterium]
KLLTELRQTRKVRRRWARRPIDAARSPHDVYCHAPGLPARMEGTDPRSARQGVTKKLRHVPALLRKTLTYDAGKRWPSTRRLTEWLAIQVFFADLYSP